MLGDVEEGGEALLVRVERGGVGLQPDLEDAALLGRASGGRRRRPAARGGRRGGRAAAGGEEGLDRRDGEAERRRADEDLAAGEPAAQGAGQEFVERSPLA